METLKLSVPLKMYECNFYFILTDNLLKTINTYEKKYKLPLTSGDYEGLAGEFTFKKYFVCIDKKYLSINSLSHEMFHITNRILNNRDIFHEETGAWLCGFLTQKVYNFLKKNKIEL